MKLLLATLLSTTLAAQEVAINTLDQTIQNTVKFWNVPGCAVSIVQKDKIIMAKGFGKKHVNKEDTIDVHTLFPIASLTKPFTAAAIGKLVNTGFCTFDDKIIKYLPSLNLSDSYATNNLTLRDCLNMHSGLAGESDANFSPDLQLSVKELLEQKLPNIPFPKGFRGIFNYQNYNYLLAASIFNTTPEQNWQNFITKQILSPLKMSETLTSFTAFQKAPNTAQAHQWKNDRFEEVALENLTTISPAAGLYSTARDLAIWLRSISTLSLMPPALLSSQVVAFRKGFFPDNQLYMSTIYFPNCQFLNYGFGWFVHDYRGIQIFHATGLTDGFTPVMAYVPRLSLGIAILPNAESGAFVHALLYQIIDLYLGEKGDWNQTFKEILKDNHSPEALP